ISSTRSPPPAAEDQDQQHPYLERTLVPPPSAKLDAHRVRKRPVSGSPATSRIRAGQAVRRDTVSTRPPRPLPSATRSGPSWSRLTPLRRLARALRGAASPARATPAELRRLIAN